MSDAQSEGKKFPNLLTKGYLDSMGIVRQALNSSRYLFLGYKGSGKSALSAHLKLSNMDNRDVIINEIMMKSFPYKLFGRIVKGEAEHEARYPMAWRWILLLYAISSLDNDTSLNRLNPDEWTKTIDILKECHLFPIVSISDLVNKSSKNSFNIDLKIFQYTSENGGSTLDTDAFINHAYRIIRETSTPNHHFLIIDGLDDFLSDREQQNISIVALINEAKDLNDWFVENKINFKIIILCRKDIFDKLSDPNKNKIKQDYSFFINWFDESDTEDYKQCNLIKLANLRGKITYPDIDDIFAVFFPPNFDGLPIANALLEYTRHTPRDFLSLLKYIQDSCVDSHVSGKAISKGIKSYSLEYFLGEIKDEMAGYIKPDDIEKNIQLISLLGKREFKLSELKHITSQTSDYDGIDLNKIFSVLFECSAIGHVKENNKFFCKYRNPNMVFSPSDTIILHKGLWKALSL